MVTQQIESQLKQRRYFITHPHLSPRKGFPRNVDTIIALLEAKEAQGFLQPFPNTRSYLPCEKNKNRGKTSRFFMVHGLETSIFLRISL